jgi:hypothetical protein
MRKIYEFTVSRKEEVEEIEVSTDKEGNEIKKTKKVEKKVPHTFFIKRPSRSENDEAEMFRAAAESDCVQRGIMTSALLAKRLLNDGGVLTDEQKESYNKLQKDFFDKQPKYVELTEVEESKRTKKQKEELKSLMEELTNIMQDMQDLEVASSNLYNRTAEAIARTKTVVWLTLHISYEEKDGKQIPFFGEGDYNKKIAKYDEMEEREDPYEYEVIQKFMLLVGSWYSGKASTKEDFDLLISVAERNSLLIGT